MGYFGALLCGVLGGGLMAIVFPHNSDTDRYDYQTNNGGTTLTFDLPPGYTKGTLLETAYFNASDAGPTDSSGEWDNDANAFDGNDTSFAATSVAGADFLSGEGTTASTSGSTISSVIVKVTYSATTGKSDALRVEEDSVGGTELLKGPLADTSGSKTTTEQLVASPSGGWTWQKVNDLAVSFLGPAIASGTKIYLAEVLVYAVADVEDYFMVLLCHDDNDISYSTPTGWTEFFQVNDDGGDDASIAGYYIKGVPSVTAFVTGTPAEEQVGVMFTVEGADQTTFEDVTFNAGSHFLSQQNENNPDPAAITTITDGAAVIVFVGNRSNATHLFATSIWNSDPGESTGWVIESNEGDAAGTNITGAPGRLQQGAGAGDAQMSWAWKIVTTASTENPPAWEGDTRADALANNKDLKVVTFAIRPGATGPAEITGTATLSATGSLSANGFIATFEDATLSGTGSISVDGTRITFEDATLSGTGSISVAGVRTRLGSATLSGTGSLTASGITFTEVSGAATLSGTGAVSVAGVRTRLGVTTLSGTGSLTAIGTRDRFAAATLSGVGSETIAGVNTALGVAALSGTGSLSGSGTRITFEVATLSGTGSIPTATGVRTRLGVATLSGTGSLSASGDVTTPTGGEFGSATLTGTGSLSAIGTRDRFAAATLSGTGSESVSGVVTVLGVATLSGTGSLSASAKLNRFAAATLSGTGSLSVSGVRITFETATLLGTGSLAAAGVNKVLGVATLSGTGTLPVSGTLITFESATLTGTGSESISGVRITFENATLTGTGSLSASGKRNRFGAATLTGTGSLSASGDVETSGVFGSATLTGTGSLSVAGFISTFESATLSGTGALSSAGVRTRLGVATLTAATAFFASGTRGRFQAGTLTGTGALTASGVVTAFILGEATLTGLGDIRAIGIPDSNDPPVDPYDSDEIDRVGAWFRKDGRLLWQTGANRGKWEGLKDWDKVTPLIYVNAAKQQEMQKYVYYQLLIRADDSVEDTMAAMVIVLDGLYPILEFTPLP